MGVAGGGSLLQNNLMETTILTLTVDDLIVRACDMFERTECEKVLYQVVGWRIEPRDNILWLLCHKGFEKVATHYMNCYPLLSDEEFFLDCIVKEREIFLKNALSDQFFDLDFMDDMKVINQILA